jgi:hypothetical protein
MVMVGDVSDQRPNTPRGEGRDIDVDMYMALSENPLVFHGLSSISPLKLPFRGFTPFVHKPMYIYLNIHIYFPVNVAVPSVYELAWFRCTGGLISAGLHIWTIQCWAIDFDMFPIV